MINYYSFDEGEKFENSRIGKRGSIILNNNDKAALMDLESKYSLDVKKQNSPMQYHMLETKSSITRGQEKFINTFKFITTTELQLKLLKSKDNEFIDVLNMMINNYNPEYHDKNSIYLSLFENSILSVIETAKDKNMATRLIMRNLSGKFAWEFNHIRAFNEKLFTETQFNPNNIYVEKFQATSLHNEIEEISEIQSNSSNLNSDIQMIVRDIRSEAILGTEDIESNIEKEILQNIEEIKELHKDKFAEMLEYIQDNIQDFTKTDQGKWYIAEVNYCKLSC